MDRSVPSIMSMLLPVLSRFARGFHLESVGVDPKDAANVAKSKPSTRVAVKGALVMSIFPISVGVEVGVAVGVAVGVRVGVFVRVAVGVDVFV